MTQTAPLTAVLGASNTGLTIGYRVLNLDRTVYSAFSATGVAETNVAGTYAVTGGIAAPDAGGYVIVGTVATDYAEAGISDGLVRLSVGIENTNDLVNDLDQALAKIQA